METSTAIVFIDFIENRIKIEDFEKWLYSSNLDDEISDTIFLELISLNFNDKSIRTEVEKIITSQINFGESHEHMLIDLLYKLIHKKIDPIEGIGDLHHNWLDSKGYNFLSQNLTIANFGEQGKSILSRRDIISSLDSNQKWKIVLENEDPSFIDDLIEIKTKLESKQILLTGDFVEHEFLGKKFKYEEK